MFSVSSVSSVLVVLTYGWQEPPIGRMLTTRNSGVAVVVAPEAPVGDPAAVAPAALVDEGDGANIPTICTR